MKKFVLLAAILFGFHFCQAQKCIDLNQIDSTQICPTIWDPACGCDCVTYSNKCEAVFYGGVTSYTKGVCPTFVAYFKYTIQGMKVVFVDSSIGPITSWNWDFGDKDTLNGQKTTVSHTYAAGGVYVVCLTVIDSVKDCQTTWCDTITIIFTQIEEYIMSEHFNIYPNPSFGNVQISLSESTIGMAHENLTLRFYNALGQLISTRNVEDDIVIIQDELLGKGIIYVQLYDGSLLIDNSRFIHY